MGMACFLMVRDLFSVGMCINASFIMPGLLRYIFPPLYEGFIW